MVNARWIRDAVRAPPVIWGIAGIDPGKDNTVKLPMVHSALQPYTAYFYRFLYNGVASRTGHFKMMPAMDAQLASCNWNMWCARTLATVKGGFTTSATAERRR